MSTNVAEVERRLAELEAGARVLDPGAAARREMRDAVVAHAETFLEGLEAGPAYVMTDHKGAALSTLPFQEEGRSLDELMKRWTHDVEVPGLNPASGGHLAYIPGGGLYPSSLGDYLAAITNRYAGVFFASPGAVRMENLLIRWMADVIGYPEKCGRRPLEWWVDCQPDGHRDRTRGQGGLERADPPVRDLRDRPGPPLRGEGNRNRRAEGSADPTCSHGRPLPHEARRTVSPDGPGPCGRAHAVPGRGLRWDDGHRSGGPHRRDRGRGAGTGRLVPRRRGIRRFLRVDRRGPRHPCANYTEPIR